MFLSLLVPQTGLLLARTERGLEMLIRITHNLNLPAFAVTPSKSSKSSPKDEGGASS